MSAIVRCRPIIGTPDVVFSAWEPTAGGWQHSVSMADEAHGRIGRVDSRRDTDLAYEQLPVGSYERIAEIKARQARLNAEAVAAVMDAFPWLEEAGRVDGAQVYCQQTDLEANVR